MMNYIKAAARESQGVVIVFVVEIFVFWHD